jgi:aminoglycoside phosphotransferase (APT) family kinase protein
MKPTWTAEHAVSPELASDLIARQFPELAPATITPLGAGWDNTAYLVNDTWVFRFPRRLIAVQLLRNETALLPALASHLPLPIPLPCYYGEPDERYPWCFAGYRKLPGDTACRAGLDESQRAAAATPIARFLRALHSFPAEIAMQHGAGRDQLARLSVTRRRPQLLERLQELKDKGLIADARPWEWIARDAPVDWMPGDAMLVHGDFYFRHLLVDAAGAPCGVIDWGDIHLGDPAVDLAIAYSFLPPDARAGFFSVYGPIDVDTERIARFRALFTIVLVLLYAVDVGEAAMEREARTALKHLSG